MVFRYYYRLRQVTADPDPDDLGAVPAGELVRLWATVADRFRWANPGWLCCGEDADDPLEKK